MSKNTTIRITEIFFSLQGESTTVGFPTVFIRLTGCPLRCSYCDTEYAFYGGDSYTLEDIMTEVAKYKTVYVTVTGGEPLAQKSCYPLLERLCDERYNVSLETSGAIDVSLVDARVTKVVDMKTPGSGEVKRNILKNIDHLTSNDQVKFVICDRDDYEWAVKMLHDNMLTKYCEVLFSPAYGRLAAAELAQWILQDQLAVRFQIQLHKYLWGDIAGV